MPKYGAAMANLDDADEAADATMANMTSQTSRMEKMDADMDQELSLLDQSDRLTAELEDNSEPGFFDGWFGKSHEEKKIEAIAKMEEIETLKAAVEIQKYPEMPPLKQGWLNKRGPIYGCPWERLYCCLYPTLLTFYESDEKKEEKGHVVLTSCAKVHMFAKGCPPGDALKHRPEKEFGFLVDPNSSGSQGRLLYYFDGEDKRNMTHWLKHIDHCAKVLQAAAHKEADDAALEEMNAKLDSLGNKAAAMGDEAKKQGELLHKIDSKVDQASGKLDSQTARLKHLD